MVTGVVLVFALYIALKILIDVKEYVYVEQTKTDKAVILDGKNYIKAASYKQKSKRLDIIATFLEAISFVFWMFFGLNYLNDILFIENSMLKSVVFINLFIIVGSIVSLPFEWYKVFKLDKEYGFSNMTVKLYILDKIKALVISILFGSISVFSKILV